MLILPWIESPLPPDVIDVKKLPLAHSLVVLMTRFHRQSAFFDIIKKSERLNLARASKSIGMALPIW